MPAFRYIRAEQTHGCTAGCGPARSILRKMEKSTRCGLAQVFDQLPDCLLDDFLIQHVPSDPALEPAECRSGACRLPFDTRRRR